MCGGDSAAILSPDAGHDCGQGVIRDQQVSVDDEHVLLTDPFARADGGGGGALRRWLLDIGDAARELIAVREVAADTARLPSHDDSDLVDTSCDDLFKEPLEQRSVAHGEHRFRPVCIKRVEPLSSSCCEYQSFHTFTPLPGIVIVRHPFRSA